MNFTVLFDACVLYPAPLRDFLLRLSCTGLFAAKWTEHIHKEWIQSVLKDHPNLSDKLERTKSLIQGYPRLSCNSLRIFNK